MSHRNQLNYIKQLKSNFPEFFTKARVLEVGSLDINGSIREFFNECDYLGIDVGPGKGVDLVVESGHLFTSKDLYDITISAECFEHNPYWQETFENMIRLTRPKGLVVFTCAAPGRREHGTTRSSPESSPHTLDWYYYRNLSHTDFENNIDLTSHFSDYKFAYNSRPADLYFYGFKK